MGIKLINIAPTSLIEEVQSYNNNMFMALHHLCTPGSSYLEKVQALPEGTYIILDNGYFETGKSCGTDALIETGKLINASCLVLPDGSLEGKAEASEAGFDIMAIPKGSAMGADFLQWLDDDSVAFIGLSYMHANEFLGFHREDPSGRSLFLDEFAPSHKKVHLLGCISTEEMNNLRKHKDFVYSQDTSLGVWSGVKGFLVGSLNCKFQPPVDFGSPCMTTNTVESNLVYMRGVYNAMG